ncbi:MAG: extracellular solute-binding protein, partial [Gorillibacterium sp.]|nr:extracellular solute-binding protein [Gorillibacterium sp.]
WQAGSELRKLPLNRMLDLSGEPWVNRLKDWAKNGATIDGKLYGLNTWSVDGWGFVYNTQLFEKLNIKVPTTYEEFIKVCEVLKSNGVTPVYENAKDLWHTPLYLNAITGEANLNMPGLYDKLNTNQAKLTDVKEFEMLMSQMKELNDKGYLGKDVFANTWEKATEALGTGKYAMFLGYTTWQNEVEKAYPEAGAKDWKMFPSPLGVEGKPKTFGASAGGIVQLVNKDSKHLDAVRQWFNYFTQADVLDKFYKGRDGLGVPSFKDVTKEAGFGLSSITEAVNGNFVLDAQGGILYMDFNKIGSDIQAMLAGGLSPKQVIENIDKDRIKTGKVTNSEGFK